MQHFWLRHEVKEGEGRSPLLPTHAAALIQKGHKVSVERSATRCVADALYEEAGAQLVETGSWVNAPKDAVILGLKELPESNDALVHNHIFFAHCFKGQGGSAELLNRFKSGGGTLWDLEFLTLDNGRRVAAFGRAAGIAGMAVGLLVWAYKQLDPLSVSPCPPLVERFQNYDELATYVKQFLDKAKEKSGKLPTVIVIGALGRCGGGSVDFAEKVGITPTKWDLDETKKGGPFPEILQHDIFVNCIYLMTKIPPFVTSEGIAGPGRVLSVIADVSCDTSNPNNPIPVYNQTTTFLKPTLRATQGDNPLDVIAIDHLPSLVPAESSKEFDDALIEHLLAYPNTPVWTRAKDLFHQKTKEVLG
uniref:Saccharopine dehydrogenase [NAD(+), L-lysine-forming] n=1 Tax=Arcella intermedia TaxID=1963864 RepID=A0A6B2L7T4_9EUKA